MNNLPKIIPRISLTNFHKSTVNSINLNPNVDKENKLNLFNKTSGALYFRGATLNSGAKNLKKLNTDPNKNINFLSTKDVMLKYNLIKKSLNNKSNKLKENIQINEINSKKEKKKIYLDTNLFNKKIIIDNNNKYCNKVNNVFNHDAVNDNLFNLNNNLNIIGDLNKNGEKNIEEKEIAENNLCMEENISMRENNDSFINELNDILSNVNGKNEENKNIDEVYKNDSSEDDDKEPDPRINFEQISRLNKSRPQTSYGGLNVRRKNLQSALNNRKENNRPVTSNLPE